MKIGMGLEARQTMGLKQVLAPRMIQSMEILQLPIAALQERIEKELQENPVLELKDTSPVDQPENGESLENEAAADAAAAVVASDDNFNPDAPLNHNTQDASTDLEF